MRKESHSLHKKVDCKQERWVEGIGAGGGGSGSEHVTQVSPVMCEIRSFIQSIYTLEERREKIRAKHPRRERSLSSGSDLSYL